MGDVIELAKAREARDREHVMVDCTSVGGVVHVYPLSYFRDFCRGADVDPLPDEVIRRIAQEWLEALEKKPRE